VVGSTCAITGCGIDWIVFITSAQTCNRRRMPGRSRPSMSLKSSGGEHLALRREEAARPLPPIF
jgi:hypothetical protein